MSHYDQTLVFDSLVMRPFWACWLGCLIDQEGKKGSGPRPGQWVNTTAADRERKNGAVLFC